MIWGNENEDNINEMQINTLSEPMTDKARRGRREGRRGGRKRDSSKKYPSTHAT